MMNINKNLGQTSLFPSEKHNPRFHLNTQFLHANSKYLNIIFPSDHIFTAAFDCQSLLNLHKWDAWIKHGYTINLEVAVSNTT